MCGSEQGNDPSPCLSPESSPKKLPLQLFNNCPGGNLLNLTTTKQKQSSVISTGTKATPAAQLAQANRSNENKAQGDISPHSMLQAMPAAPEVPRFSTALWEPSQLMGVDSLLPMQGRCPGSATQITSCSD